MVLLSYAPPRFNVASAHGRAAIRRRVLRSEESGQGRKDGNALSCWVAAGLLAAMLPLSGHADTAPVERSAGAAGVVVDGVAVGIPPSLVQAVDAAVAGYGNDPEGLAAAMQEIMAEAVAAAACDTDAACERLAAAVVALAVSQSNRQADIVGAIIQGVSAAVPMAKTDILLAAVGSAQQAPRDDPADTAQPPKSASPIG